jgi:fibronectin type 3 domain-containing protein
MKKILAKKNRGFCWGLVFLALLFAGCSQPVTELTPPAVLTGTVSVTGTARVGQPLTANTGITGENETISYIWQRSGSVEGDFTNIDGAADHTYLLVSSDEDQFIRVTVKRTGYSGTINSSAVGPVTGLNAGTVDAVTITPKTVSVERGWTRQFYAAVTGSSGVSQSVTWSITGTHSEDTTISASGLLSVAAHEEENSLTVKVVSNADSTKSDTASVTVTAPLFAEKYNAMYIIGGEAGIGNWMSGSAGTEMTKNLNGIFTWEGTLQKDTQFKFHDNTAYDWNSGHWFTADGNGAPASGVKNVLHTSASGTDNAWKIPAGGVYGITLDTESLSVAFTNLTPGSKPAAPTGLARTAAATDSLSISWINAFGAEKYNVYAGTSGSPKTLRGSPDSANYTITGLSPGTTYYISVTAENTKGKSGHSPQITAETVPSAPAGLTAGTVTSNSVNLTWTGVPGAANYRIYAGADVSGMTLRGSVSTTNYTLYAEPNTAYYAAVSAENSGGESERSTEISVKTKLPAPSGVTAAPLSGTTTIQISWNVFNGASSYRIYRSTNETDGYSVIGTSSGASFNDTGRVQSTAYYYKVSAVGSDGVEGDLSPPSSATITAANNEILSFKFRDFAATGDINAVINGTNITVTVPSIVNLTELVPTISHNGASVAPASGTAQNFSAPLTYTVTAENDAAKNYTVTVTVANDSLSSALIWLGNNAKNNRTYTIVPKRDEAIGSAALSYNDKSVKITLKGGGNSERVISLSGYGALFTVGRSVTLILGNNITLRGKSGNTEPLVKLDDASAVLVMNAGSKVTGNTVSAAEYSAVRYGGGVYAGSGSFIMDGGTISNNTIAFTGDFGTGYGGGVYVGSGSFTMNSGTISGNGIANSAFMAYGGGVCVRSGAFTMRSGTINGNAASASAALISDPVSRGGGVYAGSGAVFTMEGGTISGNTASASVPLGTSSAYGGGVSVGNGTFRKTGGSISSNTLSAKTTGGTTAYVLAGSSSLKRDTAAGTDVALDSTRTGGAGGWE